MEQLIIQLAMSYGIEGAIVAILLSMVYLLNKRLGKRDDRVDELSDTIIEVVKENSTAITKLTTIIEERGK